MEVQLQNSIKITGEQELKIKISEIAPYGRFYSDLKNHTKWWLCLQDFKIYDTETIISLFKYETIKEIKESNSFIALFKTDIINLEKEYLNKCLSINEKELFHISQTKNFDIAFKIYIESICLERDWYAFEMKKLCKDAIEWCIKNSIPYYK